jgi:hypothetical protein
MERPPVYVGCGLLLILLPACQCFAPPGLGPVCGVRLGGEQPLSSRAAATLSPYGRRAYGEKVAGQAARHRSVRSTAGVLKLHLAAESSGSGVTILSRVAVAGGALIRFSHDSTSTQTRMTVSAPGVVGLPGSTRGVA